MSMIDQFQKLDDLIVERTTPEVCAMLRNQLSLTREQIEAYQESSDRQDQTLATQAKTIATLQDENKKLVATITEMESNKKRKLDDWFREQAQKQAEITKRHTLDYNA